jgi:hypothetical protein
MEGRQEPPSPCEEQEHAETEKCQSGPALHSRDDDSDEPRDREREREHAQPSSDDGITEPSTPQNEDPRESWPTRTSSLAQVSAVGH